MKEMLESIPRIELALIIIGVFVLILGIILVYAMIHEYRIFKSKEGCTPTEWREEQVANAAPDDEKQD